MIRDPGTTGKMTLIKDWYAEPYRDLAPDFVCCKMTLEHVHDVAGFLRSLRRTVGDRPESVVFFMIPEITRILSLRAFWDIYYEHCSYLKPGLARPRVPTSPGSTRSRSGPTTRPVRADRAPGPARAAAISCRTRSRRRRSPRRCGASPEASLRTGRAGAGWLDGLRRAGEETVLWGGGSKAVAFLTTLDVREGIDYAVDINPRRSGTFLAGTGQQIVAPEFLAQLPTRRGDRHVADLPAGDHGAARQDGRQAAAPPHGGDA